MIRNEKILKINHRELLYNPSTFGWYGISSKTVATGAILGEDGVIVLLENIG